MRLTVNSQSTEIPPNYRDELLLWFLRDAMGLTGTHYGCGVGKCGSCMVLVNGIPTRTCQTDAASVIDAHVVTIEGLSSQGQSAPHENSPQPLSPITLNPDMLNPDMLNPDTLNPDTLHPVQQAFTEIPLQCMWCLPGHVMTAVALLEKNDEPSDEAIASAIEENLCRCGGYNQIKRAIARAVELRRERLNREGI
jgi:aerobic-type carbon monoxide dehydrogenase small subunit (CoxS/CutS family)